MESIIDEKINKKKTNRAVSPVIGVILMVAITVILAAVIGVFVLGFGESVSESPPQAQFSIDYSDGNATITHEGGDSVNTDDVELLVDGDVVGEEDSDYISNLEDSDTLRSGSSVTIEKEDPDNEDVDDLSSDNDIRLVWENSGGDRTVTLFRN